MTKKDFEVIARALNLSTLDLPTSKRGRVILRFAGELAFSCGNSRFDKERFCKAASTKP